MYRVIPYTLLRSHCLLLIIDNIFTRDQIPRLRLNFKTRGFSQYGFYLPRETLHITLDILYWFIEIFISFYTDQIILCASIIWKFNYYSKLHYTPFLDIKWKLHDMRSEREIILFKSRKIQYPFAINQKSGKMPIISKLHKIILLMYLPHKN